MSDTKQIPRIFKRLLSFAAFWIVVYLVNKMDMKTIEGNTADQAIKAFNIAVRQGDRMQAYVQAGMVAQIYLQEGDEAGYAKWRRIEKELARENGMDE